MSCYVPSEDVGQSWPSSVSAGAFRQPCKVNGEDGGGDVYHSLLLLLCARRFRCLASQECSPAVLRNGQGGLHNAPVKLRADALAQGVPRLGQWASAWASWTKRWVRRRSPRSASANSVTAQLVASRMLYPRTFSTDLNVLFCKTRNQFHAVRQP